MQIATILPTRHLDLDNSQYHLCLAHHLDKDPAYKAFFRQKAIDEHFVIMDNGACENGKAMRIEDLYMLAISIGCQEIVLPDEISEGAITIHRSYDGYKFLEKVGYTEKLMVVPQGHTAKEWIACIEMMLVMPWKIDTVGISRFIVPKFFPTRTDALLAVPKLLYSDKDIHLLGCPETPNEISDVRETFPGRIRGVDSGIAAIYTQEGLKFLDGPKPARMINLEADLDLVLLQENISSWKQGCVPS